MSEVGAPIASQAQSFHVEKSISIGHILTTIVMLVTAFTYVNDFDKRLSQTEQNIEFMKSQRQEDVKRVEKRLDSMDRKLDELLAARAGM